MPSSPDIQALSLQEKLQLMEALWDSIANEPDILPDDPSTIKEVRERIAEYKANPGTGIPWETVKKNLRTADG